MRVPQKQGDSTAVGSDSVQGVGWAEGSFVSWAGVGYASVRATPVLCPPPSFFAAIRARIQPVVW